MPLPAGDVLDLQGRLSHRARHAQLASKQLAVESRPGPCTTTTETAGAAATAPRSFPGCPRADLGEEVKHIRRAPVLDDFPVRETEDVDPGVRDADSGWCDAQKLPTVRAMRGDA